MYYGRIIHNDTANGTGIRTTIFVSGCNHKCDGCFQPQTWDFKYGKFFGKEAVDEILKAVSEPYIKGLTILGGEPMEPRNQMTVLTLLQAVHYYHSEKDVWVYTGCTLEELLDEDSEYHTAFTRSILQHVDVLVDGRFEKDLRDLTLRFRGSANQRLIDMPRTLASGNVVEWNG